MEVSPGWSLGIDIFAEWDLDNEFNMGPGKCLPRLSLISAIDGKEISKGINDVCHSDADFPKNGQGRDHPMQY